MAERTTTRQKGQGSRHQSGVMADLCYRYVRGLLGQLAMGMDRRLVQTFLDLRLVIVMHRHRN